MPDNQKYYYLKLKDNFFDTDEMIVLESMPDGYLYSNILLKLYLRSLKYNGRLMFNDRIPFNSTMLAQVTRHNVGVIEKAMQIFQELGLVEILDNGAIYLSDIQNFIGKSTTEADRIRSYRKQIESEKTDVQKLYKCTPEIELETEREKDIELDSCAEPKNVPATGTKKPRKSKAQAAEIPTVEELTERFDNSKLAAVVCSWFEYKQERGDKPYTPMGMKSFLTTVERFVKNKGVRGVCQCIELTMGSGYQGVLWDKCEDTR